MPLSKISLLNFRCFDSLDISLSPGANFFYGKNGCGKTSILEAAYMFSSGKSFKSSNIKSLIKHNADNFFLKGYDNEKGYIFDIQKNLVKPINIKLNNERVTTSILTKNLPCSAIHNNTFSFASATPEFRRRLIDRSIFIAEENFSESWFSMYRALKQRNAMLKKGDVYKIDVWDKQFSCQGKNVSNMRQDFFDKTHKEFSKILQTIKNENLFNFLNIIKIDFFQGWDPTIDLMELLSQNLIVDKKRRSTSQGPHKSDIKFLINDVDAKQFLSRGEQKFFSILWSCAQNEVLKNHYNIDSTLIIDDIKSELDDNKFYILLELLSNYKNQIIFSCIEDHFSSKITTNFKDFKKFHVEQF